MVNGHWSAEGDKLGGSSVIARIFEWSRRKTRLSPAVSSAVVISWTMEVLLVNRGENLTVSLIPLFTMFATFAHTKMSLMSFHRSSSGLLCFSDAEPPSHPDKVARYRRSHRIFFLEKLFDDEACQPSEKFFPG